MQYFKGKKVLVYGMGDSGYFASKLLFENEACVGVFDDDKAHKNLFCFDEDPLSGDYDLVVISPGIKMIGNPLVEGFKQKNIPVISEIDLGFNFLKGKLIAITGTNGKTTTTKLLGEIFKQAGHETFVCGNIGLPICAISQKTNRHSITICEVSNFQLESTKVFNPDVACILNLQEDHIDRHGNFAEYVRVKNKITQNFGKNNVLFYNLDDENCGLVNLPKKAVGYSAKEQKGGGYVKDGIIYFNKTKIMETKDVPLVGEKNLQNVVCALSVASFLKVRPEVIAQAVKDFAAPKHRLEFVGRFHGVEFFDDSKATNVPSVIMAIEPAAGAAAAALDLRESLTVQDLVKVHVE